MSIQREAGPWSRRQLLGAAATLLGSACVKPLAETGLRVSESLNKTVETTVDIHCHLFNGTDLPVLRFLEKTQSTRFSPGLVGIIRSALEAIELDSRATSTDYFTEMRSMADAIDGKISHALAPARSRLTGADFEKLMLAQVLKDTKTKALPPDGVDPIEFALSKLDDLGDWESRMLDPELPQEIRQLLLPVPGERVEKGLSVRGKILKRILMFFLPRLADFFRVGANARMQEAGALATTYPEVSLFTPSLVDFDYWTGEAPASRTHREASPTPPAQQIQLLERLAKASILGKIPGLAPQVRIHPFAAFDPLRELEFQPQVYSSAALFDGIEPDLPAPTPGEWSKAVVPTADVHTGKQLVGGSFGLVRYAIERGGFLGVKLYPPVGFQATGNTDRKDLGDLSLGAGLDAALRRFYAWCERNQVPVMAHCGSFNSFGPTFADCGRPKWWGQVLKTFPDLRLNLAHGGHLDGLQHPDQGAVCGREQESWFCEALELVKKSKFVFLDLGNSELATEPQYVKMLKAAVEDARVGRRVMYGSDWFMNTMSQDASEYYRRWNQTLTSVLSAAAMAEIRGKNALRFLGLLDDENLEPRPTLNRARLTAFCPDGRLPPWLGSARVPRSISS